jgi:hypothetical protein
MTMKGPYLLAQVSIIVAANKKGVYVLSRDGKNAHYVGKSDNDLQQRIKSSTNEGQGYNYFWFHYTTTGWQAYQSELYWYRHFWPYLDNSIEPAPPAKALVTPSGHNNQPLDSRT